MITENLISTVPWDDAGAYVRFSVTFQARGGEKRSAAWWRNWNGGWRVSSTAGDGQ